MNRSLLHFIWLLYMACQPVSDKQTSDSDSNIKIPNKASIQDVDRGIRANIETRTKEGGGYFSLKTDTLDLRLKLVRVHTEYLSVLGPDRYFACVDLATENGDVYDVDFFLNGTAENMEVTLTNLHKLNGKPFYTWKQADDKTWSTVPVKKSTKDLLGVVETLDGFSFFYEVRLPQFEGEARLWMPIAQTDRFQTVKVVSIETPGVSKIIREEQHANSILYVELRPEDSSKNIRIEYRVQRLEKSPYAEPSINAEAYLGSSPLIPVGDRFAVIAREAINEKHANSPLTMARALYDYIIDNMRYAKEGVYGTGDANYACDAKSGNCTEFHSFFISLCRSVGIPARFAVGASIPSERDEGGVDGYHCWAEFYAEGKWWPVDISEANKYTPLATYYFGHHPANRIELSKGRDLAPNPGPVSGSIPFFAYPILEIGGKRGNVETIFSFKRDESGT